MTELILRCNSAKENLKCRGRGKGGGERRGTSARIVFLSEKRGKKKSLLGFCCLHLCVRIDGMGERLGELMAFFHLVVFFLEGGLAEQREREKRKRRREEGRGEGWGKIAWNFAVI